MNLTNTIINNVILREFDKLFDEYNSKAIIKKEFLDRCAILWKHLKYE